MQAGYLLIVTHPDHPGVIRLHTTPTLPWPPVDHDSPEELQSITRFEDLDAGLMHTHASLRRHLIDVDAKLYRIDPAYAVASVRAVALPHTNIWINPTIDQTLVTEIANRQMRQQRLHARIFDWIGYLALLLLLAIWLATQ